MLLVPMTKSLGIISYVVMVDSLTVTIHSASFVVGGRVLTPGGSRITISGDMISGHVNGALWIGTSAVPLQAEPVSRNLAKLSTFGPNTTSINPLYISVDGKTIRPDDPPTTVNGVPFF